MADLNNQIGGDGGGSSADIPGTRYISADAIVSGARDGSFDAPYATYQEAIDHYGVPTTQTEYEQRKYLIFLDTASYTEDVVFPMGIWRVDFNQSSQTGTTDWEIDNGENVLSTTNFKLCFLAKAANPFISATSKSGLLTDSQYKTFVFFVMAASTTSSFVISTNAVLILKRGVKFLRKA